MAELQDGIYHSEKDRPGRFFAIAFFRLRRGVRPKAVGPGLGRLWSMWQGLTRGELRDLPGVPVPVADLSVLIGYGPGPFVAEGAGHVVPGGLHPEFQFRPPRGGGGGPLLGVHNHLNFADDVRENRGADDVVVQFIANSKLAVDRAIVETWKLLADEPETPVEFSTFYLGFQRDDHRSWIDFHDGISNLKSADRDQVVRIDAKAGNDAWLASGTYLAFMRLEVDIRAWRGLGRSEQELLVGRDKLTGCPLVSSENGNRPREGCPIGGKGIWEKENDPIAEPKRTTDQRLRLSHVQRANQHRPDPAKPDSLRIFRQGYEFLEWKESAPGFRLGLNFVSFQDTPQRLFRILTQEGWLGDVNFGGDPDSQPPGMEQLLRVFAAGIYVVPPRVEGESFPGASIFNVAAASRARLKNGPGNGPDEGPGPTGAEPPAQVVEEQLG
jgi:deferrochelatase/peroxidase EfeB